MEGFRSEESLRVIKCSKNTFHLCHAEDFHRKGGSILTWTLFNEQCNKKDNIKCHFVFRQQSLTGQTSGLRSESRFQFPLLRFGSSHHIRVTWVRVGVRGLGLGGLGLGLPRPPNVKD